MLYYALVFLYVGLIANALNLAGASTVAAAECRVTDLIDGGTIRGMPTWKGTTLSILPPTITGERDFYGGLVPSPVLEVAPDMESSRIVLGKTENQGMATIGACLSQDLRKSALFNHAMFRFIVKSPAKAHTQFLKVPVLLYNGKRQGLTLRTTPPEFGISARLKADTLTEPLQKSGVRVLDNRTLSQASPRYHHTVESPPYSKSARRCPDPFQRALNANTSPSLEHSDGASVARRENVPKRMSIGRSLSNRS